VSEQIIYACQEFNSRNDRLHSSFLKRQFREILDRTMIVPGKAVAEAVELARESGHSHQKKTGRNLRQQLRDLEKSGFLKEIRGSENYKR